MDVFYSYTYGTAAWFFLEAAPLTISPTMIIALLSPEVRKATPLEIVFSRSLGLALVTLGILTVLLSGSVPLSSRMAGEANLGTSTDPEDPKSPYALPTLTVTMAFHAGTAFYAYMLWTQTGITSFALAVLANGLLACVGVWIVLFGSSDGRISRKTGADKRTSGFPFKNANAHSDIKKGI